MISEKKLYQAIQDSIHVKTMLLRDSKLLESVKRMGDQMVEIYRKGGKLLIAGNGGSAADAQHFAAEITCQYIHYRKARPALALHTDTSALTAWSNDHRYESAFARLAEAYGLPGDGLVVISTSGRSRNLIIAAESARKQGMSVFGLLGCDGGQLHALCDNAVIVPSVETPRIQESHIMLIHILCMILDDFFLQEDS